ncbi:MAG: TIGR02281 family clan AA aspartic protease [Pseudomonadota bacterium]
MNRLLALVVLLAATFGAVLAYGDPADIAKARDKARDAVSHVFSAQAAHPVVASSRIAEVPRGTGGEFSLRAKINGVMTPMVVDTGASWVVLTYEAAKAAGLPLELLDYNVDIETANGHTRAARLTLDRLAIGKLVERSVPVLVVPRGQLKSNLLGMSFLDRLESWEVRADRLMLRGYP